MNYDGFIIVIFYVLMSLLFYILSDSDKKNSSYILLYSGHHVLNCFVGLYLAIKIIFSNKKKWGTGDHVNALTLIGTSASQLLVEMSERYGHE